MDANRKAYEIIVNRNLPGTLNGVDQVTRERNLNDIMDFDHVIEVREDGFVQSRPDIYAPSLYDGELDDGYQGQRWSLITKGYSGQYMYNGPIMHNSEFIGGKLADDILSEPGIYVALVNYTLDEDEDSADGWAVAKLDMI